MSGKAINWMSKRNRSEVFKQIENIKSLGLESYFPK